jgi:hypothetical protein
MYRKAMPQPGTVDDYAVEAWEILAEPRLHVGGITEAPESAAAKRVHGKGMAGEVGLGWLVDGGDFDFDTYFLPGESELTNSLRRSAIGRGEGVDYVQDAHLDSV